MKRKMKKKRMCAAFLSLVLLLGMTPVTAAFAESDMNSGSEATVETSGEKMGEASGDASSEEVKPAEIQQEDSNSEKKENVTEEPLKKNVLEEEQILPVVLGAENSVTETNQAYEGSVDWSDLKVGDIIKSGTIFLNSMASIRGYDGESNTAWYLKYRPGYSIIRSRDSIVEYIGLYEGEVAVKLAILSNTSSYAVVRGKTLTYNGQEQALAEAGSVIGGTLYYSEDGGSTYTTTEVPKAKGAGTYTVWCKVIGDANHEDSEAYCLTTSISKVAGSATVSLDAWTYGQTANIPVPESSTNGTDNVSYSYSGMTNARAAYGPSEEAPTEAGTYTVTASFAEADNYMACTAETNFTIARADAGLSLTPETTKKTYGDEGFALKVSKDSDGTASYESSNPDVATVDNNGNVTIIGIGETSITVSLPQTDNYAAASKIVTVNIAKAEGRGSVSIKGWIYGQKANTPAVVSSTNGTENVTYSYFGTTKAGKTYGPSTTAPTEAGNYTVTASFAETDNYTACTAEASFSIAEAKKESSLKPADNKTGKNDNNKVSNESSKLFDSKVSSNTAAANTVAKTGDERNLFLWLALMGLSIAGIFEVAFICRKNMRKE